MAHDLELQLVTSWETKGAGNDRAIWQGQSNSGMRKVFTNWLLASKALSGLTAWGLQDKWNMLCVWNLVADKRTELLSSSGFRPFYSNGEFLSPSQLPWLHAVLVCYFPGSCYFGAPSGDSRHRTSSIYALSLMALPDTSPHCLGLGLTVRRQPRLIAPGDAYNERLKLGIMWHSFGYQPLHMGLR
jgi:hypothetical protein